MLHVWKYSFKRGSDRDLLGYATTPLTTKTMASSLCSPPCRVDRLWATMADEYVFVFWFFFVFIVLPRHSKEAASFQVTMWMTPHQRKIRREVAQRKTATSARVEAPIPSVRHTFYCYYSIDKTADSFVHNKQIASWTTPTIPA